MLKNKLIFNFKRKSKPVSINFDYKLIVFFVIFFCGIIIGGFVVKNSSDSLLRILSTFIKEYFVGLNAQAYIISFIKVFTPFLLISITTYIAGLCGVGIPLLGFAPFLLGVVIGSVVSQYYIDFGFAGIGCCALIYLPLFATATATLIKGCCCSFDISGEIFYFVVSGKGSGDAILKGYTVKYLIFLIPIILSSIVTLILYHFFSHLFAFLVI